MKRPNKALHRAEIPLRFIAAGELGRWADNPHEKDVMANETKMSGATKSVTICGGLLLVITLLITPYFLLVMRGAILHGDSSGSISKESALSQIDQDFPVKSPQGWAIMRDTMDSWYGWLHKLDCRIRHDYWYATDLDDAMTNHTSFTRSTWNW